MTVRSASAHWDGNLLDGKGTVHLDSSDLATFDVSWPRRSEEAQGWTSPEELIGAAHAACYSMALSGALAKAGATSSSVDVKADVTFGKTDNGSAILGIHLTVRGTVEGLDEAAFQEAAEGAKVGCPVSKALTGTTITLDAKLV
ncbi:MAG: putative hydroperoxide peroxidase [Frankiales bacterium]|nr:putative hydroperoxide peroxidase [Frankiales bacterium]